MTTNVLRLLLLCACLFVGWNAPRFADDGDASDAVIGKFLASVLLQMGDGFVRQLFLQHPCVFNCHFKSSQSILGFARVNTMAHTLGMCIQQYQQKSLP